MIPQKELVAINGKLEKMRHQEISGDELMATLGDLRIQDLRHLAKLSPFASIVAKKMIDAMAQGTAERS